MNKKYYADINLYFDNMKYGVVGEVGTKRQEMIDMVRSYAKELGVECNAKTRKLYKEGKEVGQYTITSKTI